MIKISNILRIAIHGQVASNSNMPNTPFASVVYKRSASSVMAGDWDT